MRLQYQSTASSASSPIPRARTLPCGSRRRSSYQHLRVPHVSPILGDVGIYPEDLWQHLLQFPSRTRAPTTMRSPAKSSSPRLANASSKRSQIRLKQLNGGARRGSTPCSTSLWTCVLEGSGSPPDTQPRAAISKSKASISRLTHLGDL